ncbi:MAG: cytochrome C [Alphaproteobacteria bacterium HGW-Alphaproteobacteria-6]|nr:MAG: cytochrome C [Alphaproteobacteria bacterium HGW-Alphaproteobacteria-6]
MSYRQGAGDLPTRPERQGLKTDLRIAGRAGVPAGALALALVAGWWLVRPASTTPSAGVIAQGRQVYADHCAACHGADLEGQADWRSPLASGRLPAPPHDATGHSWHHPDDVLARIIRDGTAAVVGGGYQSDMPGFADRLDEAAIGAVLAYIKSTWPERERRYQERASQGN